jgi:hypothetical protein
MAHKRKVAQTNKLRRRSMAYDEPLEENKDSSCKLPVLGVKCNHAKVNKFLTDRIHKVRVNMDIDREKMKP